MAKATDDPTRKPDGSRGRGGARRGAGRPKGSLNKVSKKRKEVAEQELAKGATALEIMAATMRHLWEQATDESGKIIDEEKAKEACQLADRCAPYMHPRLAAIDGTADIWKSHEAALEELA